MEMGWVDELAVVAGRENADVFVYMNCVYTCVSVYMSFSVYMSV